MTRLAVNRWILLSCCTQEHNSSWVMHKYIPKGGTSCHEALQNMLDGMANNGVLAILLQEVFKATPTAQLFFTRSAHSGQ